MSVYQEAYCLPEFKYEYERLKVDVRVLSTLFLSMTLLISMQCLISRWLTSTII